MNFRDRGLVRRMLAGDESLELLAQVVDPVGKHVQQLYVVAHLVVGHLQEVRDDRLLGRAQAYWIEDRTRLLEYAQQLLPEEVLPRSGIQIEAAWKDVEDHHLDEAEARRIGATAAAAVDVALAARLAGVGSTERALRQADRLLPREHTTGVFEIRSLEQGEARHPLGLLAARRPRHRLLAGLRGGVPRQTEPAFGDDVALHVGGAARDRRAQ